MSSVADLYAMKPHERLCLAMEQAGLRIVDMERLAGVNRSTVWRWRTGKVPIPVYAWSIIRLQTRIRELTALLAA